MINDSIDNISTEPIIEQQNVGRPRVYWTNRTGMVFEIRGRYIFDREGRSYANDGAVAQDGVKEINPCKRCGIPVVEVTSRRTGNDYKVGIHRSYEGGGGWFYMKHEVHKCSEFAIAEQKARRTAERAWCNIYHELCVGMQVVVAKGRKFPVGTEGVIIWMADKEDAYGNIRAGVKKDDGEVMWINSANLKGLTWDEVQS